MINFFFLALINILIFNIENNLIRLILNFALFIFLLDYFLYLLKNNSGIHL